ncbi:hypothetical protein BD310DRAFT_943770 [Dichomitus squalens]|uniref:Aprataxin and PNK-like factor PBZ domain-containing protein n=1 Tax=Dichomitus squalens TaxID=114155 RepID=A0A4Q9QAS5_9APHY|nr:hypothetical protein BD310DRAFT_943770 [Dichomitus squalens]
MLSQEETLRFDRAMYRYWLWLEMSDQGTIWKETAKSTGSDDEDDDDNDDDEPEPVLCDSFLRLLSSLPSVELCEILDVGAFAEDTSLWSGKRSTAVSFVANADPAALAISLENGGFDAETMVYRNWEPVRRCIKDVLQSRQVEFDELDDKTPSAIVTAPVGAEDKCSRCESVGGLSLLGVNNMILLSGLLPVHERTWLLPGVLHRNREERKLITAHLSDTQNPISEKDIFREMVELDIASTVFDTYSEEHWSTDEWYCLACIKDLYRQRFLPWWRKTKESAHGATAQEDCWYGYNCRTMTHKNAHALKLNHLCKPTRGDQTSLDPAVVNAVLM